MSIEATDESVGRKARTWSEIKTTGQGYTINVDPKTYILNCERLSWITQKWRRCDPKGLYPLGDLGADQHYNRP